MKTYKDGVKCNATNAVKWQLKVGLQKSLFQTFKVLSFDTYAKSQLFNPILESFLMVIFRYISKEAKYDSSQLLAECIFSASKLLCLETKEQEKVPED